MDPVAHTLVGAALAEAGLKKITRYATPALLIGANLPDVDAAANLWGPDAALYFRRGWSHGVLALVVLPLVLAGAIWLWHHWRGRRRSTAPPLHVPLLIGLCFLAVWSHPLLDWLNTYGVRLLMPFSGEWFYGDTLFIVDPWFWLMTAAGVVLARSNSYPAMTGWVLLALLASVLIVGSERVQFGVKLVWLAGVLALVGLRWWRPARTNSPVVARTGLATLVVYIGCLYGVARLAEAEAARHVTQSEPVEVIEVQANPAPGLPLSHRLVLVLQDRYRVIETDGSQQDFPVQTPDSVVMAALADPSVAGFVNWMRYPWWRVQERGDHWLVSLYDLRYVTPGSAHIGIGFVEVQVAKADIAAP